MRKTWTNHKDMSGSSSAWWQRAQQRGHCHSEGRTPPLESKEISKSTQRRSVSPSHTTQSAHRTSLKQPSQGDAHRHQPRSSLFHTTLFMCSFTSTSNPQGSRDAPFAVLFCCFLLQGERLTRITESAHWRRNERGPRDWLACTLDTGTCAAAERPRDAVFAAPEPPRDHRVAAELGQHAGRERRRRWFVPALSRPHIHNTPYHRLHTLCARTQQTCCCLVMCRGRQRRSTSLARRSHPTEALWAGARRALGARQTGRASSTRTARRTSGGSSATSSSLRDSTRDTISTKCSRTSGSRTSCSTSTFPTALCTACSSTHTPRHPRTCLHSLHTRSHPFFSPLLHTTVDSFITNTHIGGPQAFHPTRDDVQRSGHKEVRCAAVWSARLLRQGL